MRLCVMEQRIWIEFGAIALAHGLAVASPGPDFALIVRQSLRYGRATAVRSALGIGCGVAVHAGYSVWGLGVLVRDSPAAFALLKIAGAAYLAWMGVRAWYTAGSTTDFSLENAASMLARTRA